MNDCFALESGPNIPKSHFAGSAYARFLLACPLTVQGSAAVFSQSQVARMAVASRCAAHELYELLRRRYPFLLGSAAAQQYSRARGGSPCIACPARRRCTEDHRTPTSPEFPV